MGKIVKFPIVVLTDTANETDIGVCPKLLPGLVSTNDDDRTQNVLSEHGLSNAIDTLSFDIGGSNFPIDGITGVVSGDYLPLYNSTQVNSLSADVKRIMKFNTITATGILSAYSTDDEVHIDTLQLDNPNDEATTGISKFRSINGGINQEASEINHTMLQSKLMFYNPSVGDTIGKILMKYTEAFDDDTTMFSIGNEYDKEFYVKRFKADDNTVGELIDFRYGAAMLDKVEIINTAIPLRNIRILFVEEKLTGSNSIFSKASFDNYTTSDYLSKADITTKHVLDVTADDIQAADILIAQSYKLPVADTNSLSLSALTAIATRVNANKLQLMLMHGDNINTVPKQIFDMALRPWDGDLHINSLTETPELVAKINNIDILNSPNVVMTMQTSYKLGFINNTTMIALFDSKVLHKNICMYYNGSLNNKGNMFISTSADINSDNTASKILENFIIKTTEANQSKFYQIGI